MSISARDVTGATVAVVGMARSGFAAVELLASKGASVRAIDSNLTPELREKAKQHRINIYPQEETSLEGVGLVVISPGVPADARIVQYARSRRIPVVGEVELAGWYLEGALIGITGSNGKTTTTALTGHILEQSGIPCQVGGNIGLPPTAMVATSKSNQWNVLELSSFQLEMIETFRARVGVVLNITPDHLDRHHTFTNYAAAKGQLFRKQQKGDYAVLNADDPIAVEYASSTAASPIWFSLARPVSPGLWFDGDTVYFDGESLIAAREIPLRGRHNVENIMAAAAAARVAGASPAQIAAAVRSFPGVEHRLEKVVSASGVTWYNDSKATNVDATLKAVDAFAGNLWIILGGKDKGSDYTPLREPLRQKAHAALLIGAAADKIARQLNGAAPLVPCGTLDRAIAYARGHSSAGDIVLLAPACASFDQFDSFEHRGRIFKEIVKQFAKES
ncbi:MAG TPA: UDP-N-acetylmuramoyl-L-alanine--D-glutamate ligase [Bryobacteraceae bacterium]|nr:UDP-N-acetylmuramoyl-L-alanine--D-glutamate ligase [Bryobacteraceae bacterium]